MTKCAIQLAATSWDNWTIWRRRSFFIDVSLLVLVFDFIVMLSLVLTRSWSWLVRSSLADGHQWGPAGPLENPVMWISAIERNKKPNQKKIPVLCTASSRHRYDPVRDLNGYRIEQRAPVHPVVPPLILRFLFFLLPSLSLSSSSLMSCARDVQSVAEVHGRPARHRGEGSSGNCATCHLVEWSGWAGGGGGTRTFTHIPARHFPSHSGDISTPSSVCPKTASPCC